MPMWRVTDDSAISADALKARLQAAAARPSITRDQVLRVALRAAEDATDANLLGYLAEQNGEQ